MAIVVWNGIGDLSSNPGRDQLSFTSLIYAFGKFVRGLKTNGNNIFKNADQKILKTDLNSEN